MKRFVEEQVETGNYSTPSEYVRALIRDAQARAEKKALEAKLLAGVESPVTVEEMLRGRLAVLARRSEGEARAVSLPLRAFIPFVAAHCVGSRAFSIGRGLARPSHLAVSTDTVLDGWTGRRESGKLREGNGLAGRCHP